MFLFCLSCIRQDIVVLMFDWFWLSLKTWLCLCLCLNQPGIFVFVWMWIWNKKLVTFSSSFLSWSTTSEGQSLMDLSQAKYTRARLFVWWMNDSRMNQQLILPRGREEKREKENKVHKKDQTLHTFGHSSEEVTLSNQWSTSEWRIREDKRLQEREQWGSEAASSLLYHTRTMRRFQFR